MLTMQPANAPLIRALLLLSTLVLAATLPANAITYDTTADAEAAVLTRAELQGLVGPVALYPDDLLAVVLPAATYPLQVVQAARFLDELEVDNTLRPDPEWDESVVALLNYPEVLRMMSEDLDWTWSLGDAILNQQPDVIAAIETFREKARKAGNLESDEYQRVEYEDDVIRITPVEKEVIYVPYYEPERVVIYQREPVYRYYPRPYPVYYYPYPARYSFASDYFWGVSSTYRIGWSTRSVHVHFHNYRSHPYFGRSYLNSYYYHHRYRPARYDYYRRHAYSQGYRAALRSERYRDRNYRGDRWQAGPRSGARQLRAARQVERRRDRQVTRSTVRRGQQEVRRQNRANVEHRAQRQVTRAVQRSNARGTNAVARRDTRRVVRSGSTVRETPRVQRRATQAATEVGVRPARRTQAPAARENRRQARRVAVERRDAGTARTAQRQVASRRNVATASRNRPQPQATDSAARSSRARPERAKPRSEAKKQKAKQGKRVARKEQARSERGKSSRDQRPRARDR